MNKVILTGRAVATPETRTTQTGKLRATFTLAVPRTWKRDETDFFQIVTWGKTAGVAEKYIAKGQRLTIDARLEVYKWQDQDGNKKSIVQIVAENIELGERPKERKDGYRDRASEKKKEKDFDDEFAGEFAEDMGDDELPF